jgi:APA family basic amino acid/polyamine antiporter
MGRDGVFFRGLGRVHPGYRTPATAICVTAAMAVALVVAAAAAKHFAGRSAAAESNPQATAAADGAPGHTKGQSDARTPADEGIVPLVVKSLRNDSIFALLTNCVIFASSIFYMVGGLAVIVLRRRRPQWERPYRTWGYPVVPILFSAAYVWFLCRVYDSNPLESRTGLLFIALGLPVYFAYQRWSRRRNDEA